MSYPEVDGQPVKGIKQLNIMTLNDLKISLWVLRGESPGEDNTGVRHTYIPTRGLLSASSRWGSGGRA